MYAHGKLFQRCDELMIRPADAICIMEVAHLITPDGVATLDPLIWRRFCG